MSTFLRGAGIAFFLLAVLAFMLLATAPVSLWLGFLTLPSGISVSRSEGSLRQGELILDIKQLGRDRPVFLSWQGCETIAWERCWQASGRAVQEEGRIDMSLAGNISISEANLGGNLTLKQLFIFPVAGSWQADIRLLAFNPAACLPAEIDAVQASVVMRDAVVLDYPFDEHYASVSRFRGQDLQVIIEGDNVSGEVVMGQTGA